MGAAAPPPSTGYLAATTGLSAGLDILAGVFGFLAGQQAQQTAESRARMIRTEAEIDAQRYSEQAQDFKAKQKLSFLKSGVTLSGSPLDILDETARVTQENLSAIRARGAAGALDMEMQGIDAAQRGRAALLGGGIGAIKTVASSAYQMRRDAMTATTLRNDTRIPSVTGYGSPGRGHGAPR